VPRWLRFLAPVCLLAGMSAAFGQSPNEQISIYAIDGLALGARIPFDSSAYRQYKCDPSDQFDGFTWCQRTRQERERGGSSNASYSVLHSRDGSVVYVNRYQAPAFFGSNEADRAIQSYSRKFGEAPRTTIRMPHQSGLDGILASWGKSVLEPLDIENRKAFAEGRRLTKGYYIDFIGNFDRSAKEGFPLYRISGGPGFIWVASFDQRGRGTLRLVAVDASAFYPELVANPPPSEIRDINPTAAARPNAGADIALQRAEKVAEEAKAESQVAHEEAQTAKRDAQLAKTEVDRLNAEKATLSAALERSERDKTAAEGKAQAMQSVAYGAIIIALLAIVSAVIFVGRSKLTLARHRWIGPETIPMEVTGHSPVAETQPKSTSGESQRSEVSDIRSSSSEAAHASTSNADIVGAQSESGVSETKSKTNSDTADRDVTMPTEKVHS
jgi:hypothetical protein